MIRIGFHRPSSVVAALVILLALFCMLTSCGGNTAAQTQSQTPTPTFTPTPTLNVPRKDVSFQTSDNVKIGAWLYGERSSTAIICSHERFGTKAIWDDSAPWLANQGFMVLAYDYRGRGDSGGEEDIAKSYKDLLAAIDYAKGLGAKKIILLGSSIGTAISEIAASRTHVDGVISLSPAYYAPMDKQDFLKVTAPKLLINSEGDTYSSETRQMYQDAKGTKELHIYPGDAHGVSIFLTQNRQDLLDRILAFVKKYAPLS